LERSRQVAGGKKNQVKLPENNACILSDSSNHSLGEWREKERKDYCQEVERMKVISITIVEVRLEEGGNKERQRREKTKPGKYGKGRSRYWKKGRPSMKKKLVLLRRGGGKVSNKGTTPENNPCHKKISTG